MSYGGCLIPSDRDDFSRRTSYALMENVRKIRQDHKPVQEVEGIVVNPFKARASLPRRDGQRRRRPAPADGR